MCVDGASVVGRLGFAASTSGTFPNRVWFVRPPPPSWLAGASAVAALEAREADAAWRCEWVGGIGNLRALATRIMLCRVCVYVSVYVLLILWYVTLCLHGRA